MASRALNQIAAVTAPRPTPKTDFAATRLRANGTAMSDFKTRLLTEIGAAARKSEARRIVENYSEMIAALEESARECLLSEIQDTIAQLPD
jgi:hypothetical protein